MEGHKPVEGVQIEAEVDGETFRTATDKDGRFVFRLIQPARFEVRAIAPEKSTFFTHSRDAKFFLIDERTVQQFEGKLEKGGCAYFEFNLLIDRGKRQ